MLDESVDKNGKLGGLWFSSVNLFTNILIIVSIELLLNTKYHTWINCVILIVITFIAYIIFIIIVHNMSMFNSYGTMYVVFNSGKLWLNLLLVGGTCGLIDYFILCFHYIFFPSLTTKLQVLVNKKSDMNINNINKMPKLIKEILGIYGEYNVGQDVDLLETKKFQDNNKDIIKINNKEDEKILIDEEEEKEKKKDNDKSNKVELMRIKNNKSRDDKINKKNQEAQDSNENDINDLYHETKTKNVNKVDVVIVKGQNPNELIIEEDNHSKEAFLK
jgi:hypothetical protein